MTIQLRVGKKFLDRRNRDWRVVRHDPGHKYPYVAVRRDQQESFNEDGRWTEHCEWEFDLVREVK